MLRHPGPLLLEGRSLKFASWCTPSLSMPQGLAQGNVAACAAQPMSQPSCLIQEGCLCREQGNTKAKEGEIPQKQNGGRAVSALQTLFQIREMPLPGHMLKLCR